MTTPSSAQPGIMPYSTLPELRAEHARLLDARRAEGDAPDFLKQVAEFIARGAATGAYIDNEEDRRGAQSLLDFWANVLYRANDLKDADVVTPDPTLADFDFSLAPELPDEPCPYRGLEAFREVNSAFFFGREQLVDELVERLNHERLLALVGSSGSGKSSVVFGGLLPRLKHGVGEHWRYVTMVPGAEPLDNLARVIQPLAPDAADAADGPYAAVDAFRRNPNHLADLANAASDPAGIHSQPIVLVVDQFEEAFTLCTDDQARKAFTDQLIGLMQTPELRHIVILTMRSDFVDSVAKLPEFKPLFDRAQVDVRAMGIDELRAAIEKPAEKVGLKFDDGIVSNLIETILGEQAGLPLLQFTLLKLWEKRNRNRITKEVHKAVGDPRQALSRSAEAFYEGLIFQNQVTARLILMKMVRPALEGGREFTSNRIPLASVFDMGEPKDRVEDVLRRLIFEERLVKLSGVASNGQNGQTISQAMKDVSLAELATQTGPNGQVPQIEVAHEALVRNWPRLATWLDEARVELRKRFALTQLAREWQDSATASSAGERDPNLLLRGRPLEDAEAYQDLNEAERAFVQASRAAVAAEERAKEEARQREIEQTRALAEAERLRAEQQARSNQRLRQLLTGLVALALVALALAGLAFLQRQSAESARADAQTQQALAQTEAAGAVLAKETAEWAGATAQAAQNEAEANERKAQAAATTTFHAKQTADAAALLAMEEERRARTAEREAESRRLAAEANNLLDVSVLDSLRAAMAAITTTTSQNEPPTQAAVNALRRALELPLPRLRLTGHMGPITAAQFSPDGMRIATTGDDGTVRIWDAASGQLQTELKGHAALISSAHFSPDGNLLVTAGHDGAVRVWDLTELPLSRPVAALTFTDTAFNSAQFSPDGRLIAVVGTDLLGRIWNFASDRVIPLESAVTLPDGAVITASHAASINTAAFSRDGQLVVTASDDGTARIWGVSTGREVGAPLGDAGSAKIKVAHFSPDGSLIVTGSEDGVARLWDTAALAPPVTPDANAPARQPIGELRGHEFEREILAAEFSPDGSRIITASDDGTARIWDAETRKTMHVLREHRNRVLNAHFSPDGQSALTTSADGTALVWNVQPGTVAATLLGHAAGVNSAYFSPDGQRIVTASDDQTVRIWTVAGRLIAEFVNRANPIVEAPAPISAPGVEADVAGLAGTPAVVSEAQFSPDGRRIVLASLNNTAVISDLDRADSLLVLTGHDAPVLSAAFSPNGRQVATASADGSARIWNAQTGLLIRALEGHDERVESVVFSPDGRSVATASADDSVHLWDVTTGETQRILRGHEGDVLHVAYSRNSAQIVTASEDGTARIWDAVTGEEQFTLIGHESGVNGAAFSPDGQIIVTAGSDRTVRLWDANTGNALAVLPVHADRVMSAAFSPDGKFIVSASADSTAKVLVYRLDDLLALAAALAK